MLCYLDDSKSIMIHLRIKQIINYKYRNEFEVKIYEKIKKIPHFLDISFNVFAISLTLN